ncbi:MAG: DUF3713 domain-containing protein, partial [Mycoplasma sp.]
NDPFKDYLYSWIDYKKYDKKLSHKSSVTDALLGIQSSYNDNYLGNSVIKNGIAGVLPYERNLTLDATPKLNTDDGVINKTFGTFDSLEINPEFDSTKSYKETELNEKKKEISNQIDSFIENQIDSKLIQTKNLTYSSAKYNQYLLFDSRDIPSTTEYISTGEKLSNSIGDWINTASVENIVKIEQIITDLNFDNNNLYDSENISLTGSYSDVSTKESKPAVGSLEYVNWNLQYAYDVNKKMITDTDFQKYMNPSTSTKYEDLLQISRNNWAIKHLKNKDESEDISTYIQEVAAMKHAFDYNEETKQYDFTKFKKYLVNQTSNNKKAAYVWESNEKIELIDGYKDSKVSNHFDFKPFNISNKLNPYGYTYNNSPSIDEYRNENGLWKSTTTFNSEDSLYKMVAIDKANTTNYTGFKGMQFESESSGSISTSVNDSLFGSELKVYASTPDLVDSKTSNDDIISKGTLYGFNDEEGFLKAIQSGVYNWGQVDKILNWFSDSLEIDVDHVSKTNLVRAKEQIVDIVKSEAEIFSDLYKKNENAVLVNRNTPIIQPGIQSPSYFFEVNKEQATYSSAIITQFNANDVISLFDTKKDGILNDEDNGINWSEVDNNGFLGSSDEAFFMSAFDWYSKQTSFSSTSMKNIQDRQPKVYTYDRRTNNKFGSKLSANYKEDNTSK